METTELVLLREEQFRKNRIGRVVQHPASIDAEMDQRLAFKHGAERSRHRIASLDSETSTLCEEIFSKLLAAFREDHAMLGRGFNELSCCLRTGDVLGAGREGGSPYL